MEDVKTYLSKLFLNNFDCYADTKEVEPAMTMEKFISIVTVNVINKFPAKLDEKPMRKKAVRIPIAEKISFISAQRKIFDEINWFNPWTACVNYLVLGRHIKERYGYSEKTSTCDIAHSWMMLYITLELKNK